MLISFFEPSFVFLISPGSVWKDGLLSAQGRFHGVDCSSVHRHLFSCGAERGGIPCLPCPRVLMDFPFCRGGQARGGAWWPGGLPAHEGPRARCRRPSGAASVVTLLWAATRPPSGPPAPGACPRAGGRICLSEWGVAGQCCVRAALADPPAALRVPPSTPCL